MVKLVNNLMEIVFRLQKIKNLLEWILELKILGEFIFENLMKII